MKIAGLDLSLNSSGLVKYELKDDMSVSVVDTMGFTTVKKNSFDGVHHYRPKDFDNSFDKTEWMFERMDKFLEDVEYVAIEDYAFGAVGKVFHIAEFIGYIKIRLYQQGKKIRLYDPNTIKMFATTKGVADKITMSDFFDAYKVSHKPDMKCMPLVNKGSGVSPTSDIIDAFFICELLYKELQLRKAVIDLKNEPEHVIRVFNKVTKSYPTNILGRDFIEKSISC